MTQNNKDMLIGKVYLPCSEALSNQIISAGEFKFKPEFEPIFIILLKHPFKNWIIAITEITDGPDDEHLTFSYELVRVPKNVTIDDQNKLVDQLNALTKDIFIDILEIAAKEAEAVVSENSTS